MSIWIGDEEYGKNKAVVERDEKLIDALVSAIYRKFRANSHKGGWQQMTNSHIVSLLNDEIMELMDSVGKRDYEEAIEEAADVAIFAAFYADPDRKRIGL